MSKTQLIGILIGGYLAFTGYNAEITPPTPVDIIVEVQEEFYEFPDAPTDPTSLSILSKLDSVLKDELSDAFILANATMQWGEKIKNTPKIQNLSQLKNLYTEAVLIQFSNTPVAGKYKGEIDKVVNSLYEHKMKSLKDKEGNVISTDITPEIRASLVEWMNELSWKFSEVFINSIPKNT